MKKYKGIVSFMAVCVMVIVSLGCMRQVKAAEKKSATIVVKGCNISIQQGTSDDFEIQYNAKKIKVTESDTEEKTITLEKANRYVHLWPRDNVIIKVPNDISDYDMLYIVAEGGGVGIDVVNANLDIQNNGGAVSITTPRHISKDINCSITGGAGSFTFSENSNFELHLTRTNCACSMNTRFPGDRNATDYRCTYGDGTAKININAVNCSLSFGLYK